MSEENRQKHYGKFRGVVMNNIDPEQRGRVQVVVADLPSLLPSWAMPCVPVAGLQMGMFTVPMIGAGVWVEFEQGDLEYPIWTGCFWGSPAEVPALARLTPPAVAGVTIQTTLKNAIIVNDVPGPLGGIMLQSTTGATLIVNDTGIYIQNGKGASIIMVGPATAIDGAPVTINKGALAVL
jgi:uncharacterized protein involved in type VI secretion and phage assembly